jgi:hypothetical protein
LYAAAAGARTGITMIMMGTASRARPSRNRIAMVAIMKTVAEPVSSSDHRATVFGTWLRTRIQATTFEVASSR